MVIPEFTHFGTEKTPQVLKGCIRNYSEENIGLI